MARLNVHGLEGTEPFWSIPEPPVQSPSIGVFPDVLKVFAQQNSGISPISVSNAQYVANDMWGEYKYYILGGFGLIAALLLSKRR